MASHHRHHQYPNHSSFHPTAAVISAATCVCCNYSNRSPCVTIPPPQSDHLLIETLLSQLLLQQSQTPPPPLHQQKHPKNVILQRQNVNQDHQTHTLLSSLLHRIDALESSLHHISSSSLNHVSSSSSTSSSLRDVAARVIQKHFRAYLVNRSVTLRSLKDLTFIKSSFNNLRSFFSVQLNRDPEVFYHKAMDLLRKLDSIKGGDTMIRDGKRSINRDLIKFLDFIDGVCMERQEVYVKTIRLGRNGSCRSKDSGCRGLKSGRGQRVIIQKLRDQIENEEEDEEFGEYCDSVEDENFCASSKARNGILLKRVEDQNKAKKSVSFVRDGTIDGGKREQLEGLHRKVEEMERVYREVEDDEDGHTGSGGSSQTSDDGSPKIREQTEEFTFATPNPVKMEFRADTVKKNPVNFEGDE